MSDTSSELINCWLQELQSQKDSAKRDSPNYWANDPLSLVTSSTLCKVAIGTGSSVLDSILPALEATEHELIFVTCFWAKSSSLAALSSTLLYLSKKALARKDSSRIRVRICLSSVSLFQKLFHTSSPSGHTFPPSTWPHKLNLPRPNELKGLDLQIKSIFILPFSVMHPKFIISDRKRAWLPSCNVSWESWFEGSIELQGPIVNSTVEFWRCFWGRNDLPALAPSSHKPIGSATRQQPSSIPQASLFSLPQKSITTILLPSPHHRNPRFRPFLAPPTCPPTPLNTFLLSLFASARTSIYMQTPNLTSSPVLHALKDALARGVDVSILTNTRMMLLEQLVTAGTTTELCTRRLVKQHRLLRKQNHSSRIGDLESGPAEQQHRIGSLSIRFYAPKKSDEGNYNARGPVKSHFKLTIVDEEVVVLGSGNMDRASWYTSQELGIAFFSRDMAREVMQAVDREMVGRRKPYV